MSMTKAGQVSQQQRVSHGSTLFEREHLLVAEQLERMQPVVDLLVAGMLAVGKLFSSLKTRLGHVRTHGKSHYAH